MSNTSIASLGTEPGTTRDALAKSAKSVQSALRWAARNIGLVIAVIVIVTVLLFAFFPTAFTHHNPLEGVTAESLQPPSAAHPFGTDQMGRDLFARIVYGSSASLTGTTIAVLIAFVVGSVLGLISGTVGGVFDDVLMRCIDVLLAIPGLLLAMTVVAALGFGITEVAVAVGVSAVASFTRLMRSEVYRVSHARYVEAATLSGSSRISTVFNHVMPNSIGSVLSLAALEFGTALLAISALSFLGYGAQPPQPEWGSLISTGRDFIATAWWLTLLPGALIAAVVISANRVSRAFNNDQETLV